MLYIIWYSPIRVVLVYVMSWKQFACLLKILTIKITGSKWKQHSKGTTVNADKFAGCN